MTTDSRNGRIADLEAQLKAVQIQLRKLANQVGGSGGRRGRWKAKLAPPPSEPPEEEPETTTVQLWHYPGGEDADLEDTGVTVEAREMPSDMMIVAKHQDGKWWIEQPAVKYYYAYATGGIDPYNHDTHTFGVSTNLTFRRSKSDGTTEETDIEDVVYNWSLTAVEDGAWIAIRREPSGIYVVDNADCEAPPEEE